MEVNYPWPQEPPPPAPAPLYNEFLQRGREGKNEFWRYFLGVTISFGGCVLLALPFSIWLASISIQKGLAPGELSANLNPAFLGIDPNLFLFWELVSFVTGIIGLWAAVKYIHRRSFISAITASQKIRWKRFGLATFGCLLLSTVWMLVAIYRTPENFRWTFELKPFLLTTTIAILLLPAQTWWEEFMMRGYLFQGIGNYTKSAIIPIVATTFIFALLHIANPEVAANGFWASMPLYLLPGLIFSLIAAMDGGIEIPMGLHFANNLFGTIVVTNDTSAIQGYTIWRQNHADVTMDIWGAMIMPILFVALWILYKWDLKKLYKKYA